MQGGSFTITNLGTYGGIFFTPILNHPESAILGIGKIMDKPVFDSKKFVARKVLPLSMSMPKRILPPVLPI